MGNGGADALALLCGQLVVVLGGQHLFTAGGRKSKAAGRADQHHLLLDRIVTEFLQGFVLQQAIGALNRLHLGAVVFALKQRRNGGAQIFHPLRQALLQFGATPRRQAQGARLMGLAEVVQVAPVARWRFAGGLLR